LVGHAYPEDGCMYNRATAITTNGPVGHYDKIHLIDVEKKFLCPGKDQTLFSIGNFTAGIMICRDQNDAHLAESLKEKGADLIMLPAAHLNEPETARRKLDKDRGIPITRAVENEIYVFLANSVGMHVGLLSLGNSLIANPEGYVLASARESEETILSVSIS
jgi:predicted amidohydrolase